MFGSRWFVVLDLPFAITASTVSSDVDTVLWFQQGATSLITLLGLLLGGSVLLFLTVGWPSIVGLAVMAASMPANTYLTKRLFTTWFAKKKSQDQRMSVINEMLAAIRTIKSYAWEAPFMAKVGEARSKELLVIRTFLRLVGVRHFV